MKYSQKNPDEGNDNQPSRGQFIAADTLPDENGKSKQRGQFIVSDGSWHNLPDDVARLRRQLEGIPEPSAQKDSAPSQDPEP